MPSAATMILAMRLILAASLSVGGAAVYFKYQGSLASKRVVPGVRLGGKPVGGRTVGKVREDSRREVNTFLHTEVELRHSRGKAKVQWHELGLMWNRDRLWRQLTRVGRRGSFFTNLLERRRAARGAFDLAAGIEVDGERAMRTLARLKEQIDRKSVAARLDLVNRRIVPGQVGYELDIYRTLERVLAAARARRRSIKLVVREKRPKISSVELRNLKIDKVMGWFETPYKTSWNYRNRTYNLRVAARKLNGLILMPSEILDFNAALGPRTQQQGYRIAPVIARGELVDGIAGGICQISSTLFAAAFFAGLEVVKADVHSIPSTYIDIGLDATVVWPGVNMMLRNPYDFPVVIHYEVNSGRVRAELLGPKRPYKIGFERRIIGEKPFREEVRKDDTMFIGERKIEQRGQKGYTVRRRRIFFDHQGHELRSQYWTVVYPPTTMIIRLGTKPNPDPKAEPPAELPPVQPHMDPQSFRRQIQ